MFCHQTVNRIPETGVRGVGRSLLEIQDQVSYVPLVHVLRKRIVQFSYLVQSYRHPTTS